MLNTYVRVCFNNPSSKTSLNSSPNFIGLSCIWIRPKSFCMDGLLFLAPKAVFSSFNIWLLLSVGSGDFQCLFNYSKNKIRPEINYQYFMNQTN